MAKKYYVKKYLGRDTDYSYHINEAILLSGMKKKKISEITGINYQSLSYKLHGKCSWKMDDLVAIAECLDVDVAVLMGRGEN